MTIIENRCVGCAVPGYPCQGDSCPYRNAEITYCDHCGFEVEGRVYYENGMELCYECREELFNTEEE